MAARFNIELLGDKDLSAALAALPATLERKALVLVLKEAAQVVLQSARRRAPRGKTGRLARTLRVKALKRSRNRVGYGIYTGTRAELGLKAGAKGYYPAQVHLGFIHTAEFGGRHIAPRPFLRPALIENQEMLLNRIAAHLRQLLEHGEV